MTPQTLRLPATVDRPSLFLRRQPSAGAPVLYVHGATFPSALSVGFDFGTGSWLDDWTARGFDAWADVTDEAQYARFVEDVPKGHPPVLEGFHRWAPAYLASDPEAARRTPPAVRIPNGPRADNVDAWAGRLLWDPARITRPITIVRGAWDSLSRDADAMTILDASTAAPARHDVKLEAGTHLMHLETGRLRLYQAVARALKGEQP